MAGKKISLLQWLLGTVALLFIRILGILPLSIARAIGDAMATFAYYAVPRLRNIAMSNLDLAYGDTLTRAEKKRIAKGACHNICRVAVELPHLPDMAKGDVSRFIRFNVPDNPEFPRGAVIIGAHHSNWEWMAAAMAGRGFRATGVVRPLDDPRLDKLVDDIRRSTGAITLGKTNAAPTLIRELRDGNLIGLLADQNPRQNGVPVTFFGQETWGTVAPAMLALRTKAPIHLMSMNRCDDGVYEFTFHPAMDLDLTGNMREDLVRVTQQCQDAIEEIVRAHPEQYLWMHKRFKPRPRLEAEWAKKR